MTLGGTRLFLSMEARAVCAAQTSGGLGGRRLRGFVRVPLGEGALVPSASGENVVRPAEVREAVQRAVAQVSAGSRTATLILPDAVARIALVETHGVRDADALVRFRLSGALPWPAAEASFGILQAGRGRVAGAAIRRRTVLSYEQPVREAGLAVAGVRLASLLALEGVLRSRPGDALHAALSDSAAVFVVTDASGVVALRMRRRDRSAGEAGRLFAEAERTAHLAGWNGNDRGARLLLVGSGGEALQAELGSAADFVPCAPRAWPDAAEAAWLRGLV